MRSIDGDIQSGNLRGQRPRAPRLSPELAELMHMLDSLEHQFVVRTDKNDR